MSYLPIFSLALGEKMGEARVAARLCTRVDTSPLRRAQDS